MLYVFHMIMFFPHCSFFFRIGLHYKPVPHFSEFFFQVRQPADKPLSGSLTKRLFSGRNWRPDRGRDKNQAYFLLHTPFLYPQGAPATDLPQGDWHERERIFPAALFRWLRFLSEIWSREGGLCI